MMANAPEVYCCPNCERLFDALGNLLAPKVCVPVMMVCGQDDCEAVRAVKLETALAIRRSRRDGQAQRRAQRKVCSARKANQMHQRAMPTQSAQCHRGMPPEREDEVDGNPVSRAQQQAAFADGDEAQSQNELMLDELLKTFDLNDPTRTSRSRWVTNKEWQERFGITRPNSRASQLNGSETQEQHPLIKMHRLFLDSRIRNGTSQVWERSLCYVENSLFLARQRKKQDEHQLSMPAVPICIHDSIVIKARNLLITKPKQGK